MQGEGKEGEKTLISLQTKTTIMCVPVEEGGGVAYLLQCVGDEIDADTDCRPPAGYGTLVEGEVHTHTCTYRDKGRVHVVLQVLSSHTHTHCRPPR